MLSRGTLIDAEMVQSRPDASYVMAGGCGCRSWQVCRRAVYAGGECAYTPHLCRDPCGCVWMDALVLFRLVRTCTSRPHLTSVCEQPLPAPSAAVAAASSSPPPVVLIGLCAVDVASGHVLVGQFPDDEVRVACLQVLKFPGYKMRVACGRAPQLSPPPSHLT